MKYIIRTVSACMLALLVISGFALQASAQTENTLFVTLSANPFSGPPPLTGVDVTAVVSGTATGDITYRVDCTSDGTWEDTKVTPTNFYTATDICNFPIAGSYNIKVMVERGGLSFQGRVAISVDAQAITGGALGVVKRARNLTKGQTVFADSVAANPGDRLEFQVQVQSTGTASDNVSIRDTFPALLTYTGNLKVDGLVVGGDVVNGLSLGNLAAGQTKTVIFEGKVAEAASFGFGTTDVINTVLASHTQAAVADTLPVRVTKSGAGAATSVPTGPLNPLTISVVLTFLAGLIGSYAYFAKFYLAKHFIPNLSRAKSERDLQKAIERIKQTEGM